MPDGEVTDAKLYVMMDGEVVGELSCESVEMHAPDTPLFEPPAYETFTAEIELTVQALDAISAEVQRTAKECRKFIRAVLGIEELWRGKVARVKYVHRKKRGRLKR